MGLGVANVQEMPEGNLWCAVLLETII